MSMTDQANLRTTTKPIRIGLSGRLLILTIGFVMLAEVLIYVPSIANFRRNWLNDKLAAAQVAAIVAEAAPAATLPPGLTQRLLAGIEAQGVATRVDGKRLLISATDMPPEVSGMYDLRNPTAWALIMDAFKQLASRDTRPILVLTSSMGDDDLVEVLLDVAPLKAAMWQFSRNILLLSLVISGITAGLVYLSLQWLIVRPVRRVAENIMAFEGAPEDVGKRMQPDGRNDEIGAAQRAIARMQAKLAQDLRQKKHLAALGLAVSKINHDLRNMLASAQLLSDRLSELPDPNVQRFAPKLIATLDRAINFCQSTLAYGAASEQLPNRNVQALKPMIDDIADALGLDAVGLEAVGPEDNPVQFICNVDPALTIDADAEQLSRALLNLGRNAVQALSQEGADRNPKLSISAQRTATATWISISDNGPGLPRAARERLFDAFQGSTRTGGTGLGLAIAAELIHLHGGTIELEEQPTGATFKIMIPDSAHQS
jgi:signal transduction histidine kinase